ncbi:MAG: sugar nucleotide-binding protein [Myxococcota bacterium]
MKALITGGSGTVGSALARRAEDKGWSVTRWDRTMVPIDDYDAMDRFVQDVAPDVLFHLAVASQPSQPNASEEETWRVNYEWTSELSWIAKQRGVSFVFTSTVMVFTEARPGPYTIACRPDAAHDYGRDKREAERRVFRQNPDARVARLGWQIGDDLNGNQMAAWLASHKRVRASMRWIPACSMVNDTADALIQIAQARPGLYHVDANEGWSFYDLACALKLRHDASWAIEGTVDRAYDQRLLDPRLSLPTLADRIPELAKPVR